MIRSPGLEALAGGLEDPRHQLARGGRGPPSRRPRRRDLAVDGDDVASTSGCVIRRTRADRHRPVEDVVLDHRPPPRPVRPGRSPCRSPRWPAPSPADRSVGPTWMAISGSTSGFVRRPSREWAPSAPTSVAVVRWPTSECRPRPSCSWIAGALKPIFQPTRWAPLPQVRAPVGELRARARGLHSSARRRSRLHHDLERLAAVVDRVGLGRLPRASCGGSPAGSGRACPVCIRSSTASTWPITLAWPVRIVSALIQTTPMCTSIRSA